MSRFLNSLEGKLTTMEQKIQALPEELDSAVAHIDRGKLRSLGFQLNQDFNKLLDRLFAPQRNQVLVFPFIFMPDGLNGPLFRRITQEDLSRWRAAWKSDVRVVLGTVLGWDEYQNLLDEMGSLIGEEEESRTIVGIPVSTTDSPQEVKVLPKNSPL